MNKKVGILELKWKFINFSQGSDPYPESGSAIRKNLGSGSALNQCGSETMIFTLIIIV
jgi:hypothetical protein